MRQVYLFISLILLIASSFTLHAQTTFPVNGTADEEHLFKAFTNATIYQDYKTIILDATLLIREDKIVAVGTDLQLPNGCAVHDLKGKFIYPSMIDPYSSYGITKLEKKKTTHGSAAPMISTKKGAYGWNEAVKPEFNAVQAFTADDEAAKKLRDLGFGAVLTHQKDGIVRGSGASVALSNKPDNEVVLNPYASAHYAFKKGVSTMSYPSSLMGSIALLRQTYLDAFWYATNKNRAEYNMSLEAFNSLNTLPQIFEVNDYLSAIRADKIGDEFNTQYIIKGSGDEYKRLNKIKELGAAFILPVNFPDAYEVSDAYDAMLVDLADMKHWELAPANPAFFQKYEIPFAFTADGLKDPKDFLPNVRKAIKHGLDEQAALKAITYNPALLLGFDQSLGALEEGKIANFLITSGNLFDEKTILYENWVQGDQFIIKDLNYVDIRGTYDLKIEDQTYILEIKGDLGKYKGNLVDDSASVKVSQTGSLVSFSWMSKTAYSGLVRLSGKINLGSASWDGKGQLPGGTWINWSAIRMKEHIIKNEEAKHDSIELGLITFPLMGYGFEKMPPNEIVFIQGATVWTNEAEGILEKADVLMDEGFIKAVGVGLTIPEGARVIDGKGKHVTSGIIDEHSHIAISNGVNESAQAITAEVSISDVVNSDDINIYRQLAGGVTAAQLLHGSANPIGGQSALIKLRWGRSPEEMKIQDTDGFIKFALGENVKQSNHRSGGKRFPQTRMGVEQVFYDAFTRARAYGILWYTYGKLDKKELANTLPPRKDLELEALAQILNKERFISCHSYQQGEINMLMHVGDSMGFTVNTFTHILEGYKVADKMRAHGAGGSTFSDWWAYKFEVNDAIPYNGAIMHEQGIVTAYNSDDAEMGRRLNQEAAKAVKYGGVSPEEAWKFVTLNPAKLLHLDDKMGSIKVGKHGDVVIWSDNPLSIYAKAEKTFIDGQCYYDEARDRELRVSNQVERVRLMEKMLSDTKKTGKSRPAKPKHHKLYHCDTIEN